MGRVELAEVGGKGFAVMPVRALLFTTIHQMQVVDIKVKRNLKHRGQAFVRYKDIVLLDGNAAGLLTR